MTGAEVVAAVGLIIRAIETEPAIETAIVNLLNARRAGKPLTPALKHLEVLADAKLLGLNPEKV